MTTIGSAGEQVSIHEAGANEEQLAVIRHVEGPLRVLAQAGSGKTFALVRRVAALVSLGVDPARILAVTFSTKGAQEMNERIKKLGLEGVEVRTWHAFCSRVIREDLLFCAPPAWTVDEKDAEKTVVKVALGYQHLNWVGADLTRVRRYIGHCKANLFAWDSPEAMDLARTMFGGRDAHLAVRAFELRDRMLTERKLLAFDDMLVNVVNYFRADEFNRRQWAAKFDHVLTDEVQDNNRAQEAIAELLCRDHRNLMVVGDVAQSIYGFRGSKPELLADFDKGWTDARTVIMSRNYRSGAAIIRVANEVIRPAPVRVPSDMVPCRDGAGEGTATLVRANDFDDEAAEVAAWIEEHRDGGGKYADSTVLFRTNAQSRALEDALLARKVPYLIVGGVNFWQRKEVKDLLAYLRVALGRDTDGDGVKRCINAPFRYLGARFVEKLMLQAENAAGEGLTWPQLVAATAREEGVKPRQRDSAMEWSRLMGEVAQAAVGTTEAPALPPAKLLETIVQRTGYLAWLERDEGEESIENSHAANVREMLRVAASFRTTGELLDYIDENIKETARAKRQKGDRVLLMSIHRSKGLEWPRVWVVGCNEGVLPHAKGDIEEERRLAYVAVTRARDAVVCSYVSELVTRAGIREGALSRFFGNEAVRGQFTAAKGVERPALTPAGTPVVDPEVAAAEDDDAPAQGTDNAAPHPLAPTASADRLDALEKELSTETGAVRFSDSYRKADEQNL